MINDQRELELRKNLRLNWLESLAALSDIELQQRWIDRRIANPAWTYVEFMNCYFEVADDGYEALIEESFITQAEYDCIKDFHNRLDAYKEPNGHYDAAAILADPKWQEIVALGKESVSQLAILLTDSDEKKALLEKPGPLTIGDFTWPHHNSRFRLFIYFFRSFFTFQD